VIVRAGVIADEHTSPAATTVSDSKRWVSFGFGSSATRADGGEHAHVHAGEELDRYHLQAVVRVSGLVPPGLMAGSHVVRREAEGSRAPSSADLHLHGTLQPRRSTQGREEVALTAAWSNKPGRVALLLTFAHFPAFWALPKEQRAGTFLRLPDTGVEPDLKRPDTLMKRIVHRLYRATSPGSDWDYLAYFEMLPTDVAHVRDRLGQLRDKRDNKLWTHVKRETELWMVKDLSRHGTHPGA
jgi:hypothetical protein